MVEIEIPPRSAYVAVVRLALSAAARSEGVDEATVEDLKMAVSEACANAVLAHEESGCDDPVTVTWERRDGEVVVEVGDRGPVLDVPDDISTESGGLSSRLLLSLTLIRSLVDDWEYGPRPGGGMRTSLVLRR